MRKLLVMTLVLLLAVNSWSQEDSSLRTRLNKFLELSENMDLDKALDLTYPRLFSLVSRNELKREMQKMLSGEEVSVRMDSIRIDTIFPVFEFEKGHYAKIVYDMNIHMKLNVDGDDDVEPEQMVSIFEYQFGEGKVSYNKEKKEYTIRNRSEMVAIRDEDSPEWTFLNMELDSPLVGILFSEKLLGLLGSYQ